MSNVVDKIPYDQRAIFVEVLAERNESLLMTFRAQEQPTNEQRNLVDHVFIDEIIRELGPGDELSERGGRVKRAIEEFWYIWPSDLDLG